MRSDLSSDLSAKTTPSSLVHDRIAAILIVIAAVLVVLAS